MKAIVKPKARARVQDNVERTSAQCAVTPPCSFAKKRETSAVERNNVDACSGDNRFSRDFANI